MDSFSRLSTVDFSELENTLDQSTIQNSTIIPQAQHRDRRDEQVQLVRASANLRGSVSASEFYRITESMERAIDARTKELESQTILCKKYEDKFRQCSSSLVEARNQLELTMRERDHYKKLGEQYLDEFKRKEAARQEGELKKASEIQEQSDTFEEITKLLSTMKDTQSCASITQHLQKLRDNCSGYQSISLQLELLMKENQELKQENERLNQDKRGIKQCLNCKSMFSSLENTEGSCQYHLGRLKYYSCRGCGADEYYSCCNRCKNCLLGCKKGKHIAAES